MPKRRAAGVSTLVLAAAAFLSNTALVELVANELWPLGRVRITVVQWAPVKGIYERIDAFSGEYVLEADGSLSLPVIGTLPTSGKSIDEVAAEISGTLKRRLGMVDEPETSLEIVSYPPVYVVGSVTTPGAFEFRPGMTALQLFALGGGVAVPVDGTADRLRLASDLRSAEAGILRSNARLARLRTEAAHEPDLSFPPEVTGHADAALAKTVMNEETVIFAARARELHRQEQALDDLVSLLQLEIETLQTRLEDVGAAIAAAERELEGVSSLVEKGIATVSRRTDLERVVADLRFDRLNQTTAIVRAQQAISQAKREAAQLQDTYQTDIALGIQTEQATLEQLSLQRTTAQGLLLSLEGGLAASAQTEPRVPTFTLVRQTPTELIEVAAGEATTLQPGDVLKVTNPAAGRSNDRTAAVTGVRPAATSQR